MLELVENEGDSGEVNGEKGSLTPMTSATPPLVLSCDFVAALSPLGDSLESGREPVPLPNESPLSLRDDPLGRGGLDGVERPNMEPVSPPPCMMEMEAAAAA